MKRTKGKPRKPGRLAELRARLDQLEARAKRAEKRLKANWTRFWELVKSVRRIARELAELDDTFEDEE